jgi:hypothetical protein
VTKCCRRQVEVEDLSMSPTDLVCVSGCEAMTKIVGVFVSRFPEAIIQHYLGIHHPVSCFVFRGRSDGVLAWLCASKESTHCFAPKEGTMVYLVCNWVMASHPDQEIHLLEMNQNFPPNDWTQFQPYHLAKRR